MKTERARSDLRTAPAPQAGAGESVAECVAVRAHVSKDGQTRSRGDQKMFVTEWQSRCERGVPGGSVGDASAFG